MKAKRLLALVLSCCLCSSASAALAAPKNTDTQQFHRVFDAATVSRYSHFTDKTYVLPSGYTIYDGIDVSSKDGTIHWNAAAKDGIAFALIQVGNRGVKSGDLFQDEMYTAYMDGAAAADIPIATCEKLFFWYITSASTRRGCTPLARHLAALIICSR